MNMNDILVPISDPGESQWAAQEAIALYRKGVARIHLLNVQRPLPRHVAQFFSGGDLREFHRDAGMRVLEPAMHVLDAAGIPHEDHVMVGNQAEAIVRFAQEHHCSEVVLDNAPKGGMLSIFGLGSIGSQVRHLMRAQTSDVPAPEVSGST
jgi:nucleotide-binding universal stress UspA family protein